MVKRSKHYLSDFNHELMKMLSYLDDHIKTMNTSKVFAGLVVITLNIASRYVTLGLSKSMESYLKNTFSRDVLVFCIVWMGSRDIYIATILTIVFTFTMDCALNENSLFCILPETFTLYHEKLTNDSEPTEDEIKNAEAILARVIQK